MKKSLQLLLGATGLALVSATPALAIDGLTANAAVTTNYVFRGLSQTSGKPAVSAGLDYAIPGTSLAVGTWVSSIDFNDGGAGNSNSPMELDLYGNWSTMLGGLGVSIGGIAYLYPQSVVDYNVYEGDIGVSYDFGVASWSAKAFYSPDAVGADSEYFLTTGLSVPVAPWLAISGNVGYQGITGPSAHYTEYDIGGTVTFDKYSLDLRYLDTNLSGNDGIIAGTFTFKFP